MLALGLGVPLVAVNHIQSHIYACRLAAGRDIFPCVGLVVSGGHTALFRCDTALSLTLLGGTRDDAAGEAFDKVAAILGLGFPGGPAVEREAAAGNPKAFAFPRAFLDDGAAGVQLQRAEDGGALRLPRAGREPGDTAARRDRSGPTSRRASRPRSWMCWC